MKTRLLIIVTVLVILGAGIGVALASHSQSLEVRVAARSTEDGRIEFGIQQKMPDGTWSEERFPRARFFGEAQKDGRWKRSSPIEVEVLIPHPTPTAVPPTPTEEELFESVRDSVVYIFVEEYEDGVGTGWGSYGTGFVVRASETHSYVLTAAHIFTDGYKSKPDVYFEDCLQSANPGNCALEASIVGFNNQYDVAVLKIEGQFPEVMFAGYVPVQGEAVIAVGALASTEQIQFLSSIGEYLGRKVYSQPTGAATFVEHTARIYAGFSGGPVVAMNGQAIAITTAVSTSIADRSIAISYSEICQLISAWAGIECEVEPSENTSAPDSTDSVANVQLSNKSGRSTYLVVGIDLEFDHLSGSIDVLVDGVEESYYGRIYADDGLVVVSSCCEVTLHSSINRVSVQTEQGDMRCSKNDETSTQTESMFDCFWR